MELECIVYCLYIALIKSEFQIRNFIPAIEENSIVSLEEIMSLFCQLDSTAGFNDPSKLIESVSPITTDSPMGLRMFPDFPVGNNKWFDGVAQSIQSHIISAGYNFDLTGELQRY